MDSQATFKQIEETALKFALAMDQGDLDDMLNVSNLSTSYAMEWHKLQLARQALFYSDSDNRKDWIKASRDKLSSKDAGYALQKETSYWIIPKHDDCPVLTKLISFDGPVAEFEAPDNIGCYYAKEILVEGTSTQPEETIEESVSIPELNTNWP
ncbi:hypothetical protein ACTXKB_13130 [Psychrobacter aquimaris]|uniref:hypothetical protein n=1 Tax=Psychrobacter aquimaris TaxID=292733 RepID=UPI003FD64840